MLHATGPVVSIVTVVMARHELGGRMEVRRRRDDDHWEHTHISGHMPSLAVFLMAILPESIPSG